MTGEINLTECGNEIKIQFAPELGYDEIDIKIGNSIWFVLTQEQILALKEKLKEVN